MPSIKASNPDSNVQSMPSCCQIYTVGIGACFAAYSFNEGLVVFFNSKSFGACKERAKVFGGCGEYWVAWIPGYFHALKRNGANFELPDVYVGT